MESYYLVSCTAQWLLMDEQVHSIVSITVEGDLTQAMQRFERYIFQYQYSYVGT